MAPKNVPAKQAASPKALPKKASAKKKADSSDNDNSSEDEARKKAPAKKVASPKAAGKRKADSSSDHTQADIPDRNLPTVVPVCVNITDRAIHGNTITEFKPIRMFFRDFPYIYHSCYNGLDFN